MRSAFALVGLSLFFFLLLGSSLVSATTIQPPLRYQFESIEDNITIDTSGNYNGTLNLINGLYHSNLTNGISGKALELFYVDTIVIPTINTDLNNSKEISFSYWLNTSGDYSELGGAMLSFDDITISYSTSNFKNYTQIDASYTGDGIYYYCHGNSDYKSGFNNYVLTINASKSTNEKMQIYRNGVLMTMSCEGDNQDFSVFHLNQAFQIGWDGSDKFIVDEYRIYNRTLTDAQVLQLYNNPSGDITENETTKCPKKPKKPNKMNDLPYVQLCNGSNF